MTPLKFIMRHIFAMSNAELADAMGVSREAVSHWRSGRYNLPIEKLRPAFSTRAQELGLPWSDSWLFELPICNQCVGVDQCNSGCARIVAGCAAIRDGERAEAFGLTVDGADAVDLGVGHCVPPVGNDKTQLACVGNGNLSRKISSQVAS